LTDTIDYRTIGFSHNRPNPNKHKTYIGKLGLKIIKKLKEEKKMIIKLKT